MTYINKLVIKLWHVFLEKMELKIKRRICLRKNTCDLSLYLFKYVGEFESDGRIRIGIS